MNREGVVGILYRLAQRLNRILGLALPHHEHSARPLDVGVVRAQAFGPLNRLLGFLELGGLNQVARHFCCKYRGVGVLGSAHVNGLAGSLKLACFEVVVGYFFKFLHIKKQQGVVSQRLLKAFN